MPYTPKRVYTASNIVNDSVVTGAKVDDALDTLDSDLDLKAPLASPAFTGTPTGITKTHVGLGNVDDTSDATKNAASATLTNKTLTAPVINSPTGIVKADVGLGNVDNTSNATERAATATLTNKTLTTPTIGDFTNATHNHSNAAGGGAIPESSVTNLVTDLADKVDGTVRLTVASTAPSSPSVGDVWIDSSTSAGNSSFVYSETPGGTINSANVDFTTASPYTSGTLVVHLNGQRLKPGSGNDYVEASSGFTMQYAPATSDILLVDYVVTSGAYIVGTNSFIVSETPTGTVDGSNTTFTTSRAYQYNTLRVIVNGLIQANTTHVTQTSPSTGVFTLDVAPVTGDIVRVDYQFSMSTSGNADTVDGYHATTAPGSNSVPVTDSDNGLLANPYAPLIINGGCIVAQRVTAPSLSTTSQYGAVDRFRVHATGTAVSAGTIAQGTALTFGKTGNSVHVSGATITGTGVVILKHRIESKNAATLKNKIGSFQATVYHDVGSSIPYTITVRKPTALDNYTSTTTIQTSSALTVATATATKIKLENISLGDVTYGIEVEISIACGAVTTKNFHFTDMVFNEGTVAMGYTPIPFEVELQSCLRYYEKSNKYSAAPGASCGLVNGASLVPTDFVWIIPTASTTAGARTWGTMPFKVPKRTAPTARYWDGAGNISRSSMGDVNLATVYTNQSETFRAITAFENSIQYQAAPVSNWWVLVTWEADAEL